MRWHVSVQLLATSRELASFLACAPYASTYIAGNLYTINVIIIIIIIIITIILL